MRSLSILNNTWCKPRDIVRLITSAQNSLQNNSTAFTLAVFNSAMKSYSEESLQEIKEELRALYTPEQIDTIIVCFTGFRTSFSIKDLQARIHTYFPESILETHFIQVLNDLYRLGFIGNFLPAGKVYHWQHKGDPRLIMTDDWRICIHYALHLALSLGSRNDFGLTRGKEPQTGDFITATITRVGSKFALASFTLYGNEYEGIIYLKEFGNYFDRYIPCLYKTVKIGDTYHASLTRYNEKYSNWNLQLQPSQ